ncbi:hypothetical protein EBU94_08440, partial [bacterium]|nr:hypothetical protein [bacterium]
MKIGTVYNNQNDIIIQLTEQNLNGYALFLRIYFAGSSWTKGQPLFDEYSSVTNLRKANEYIENANKVTFEVKQITPAYEARITSTYQPPNVIELGVGDRFLEAGKNNEYTVLGFFERQVIEDTTNPKSKMVSRRFPYAINLEPLLNYVTTILNTREGLMGIVDQSDALIPILAAPLANLKAIFYANTRYPYWSIDAPRVSSVIYIKQPPPLKKIDFVLDFNAVTKG